MKEQQDEEYADGVVEGRARAGPARVRVVDRVDCAGCGGCHQSAWDGNRHRVYVRQHLYRRRRLHDLVGGLEFLNGLTPNHLGRYAGANALCGMVRLAHATDSELADCVRVFGGDRSQLDSTRMAWRQAIARRG